MSVSGSSSRGIWVVAVFGMLAIGAGNSAPVTGKALYDRECAQCHGATGKGDGEESMYLTPAPKDFTSGVLDKRSDEFLAAVIANGGESKGLSKSMPAFHILSKEEVKSLVAYIRQLGKEQKAK